MSDIQEIGIKQVVKETFEYLTRKYDFSYLLKNLLYVKYVFI